MSAVECGRCGWTHEVDESLPADELELEAVKLYVEHTLEVHPDVARQDRMVNAYVVGRMAEIVRSNGTPFHFIP